MRGSESLAALAVGYLDNSESYQEFYSDGVRFRGSGSLTLSTGELNLPDVDAVSLSVYEGARESQDILQVDLSENSPLVRYAQDLDSSPMRAVFKSLDHDFFGIGMQDYKVKGFVDGLNELFGGLEFDKAVFHTEREAYELPSRAETMTWEAVSKIGDERYVSEDFSSAASDYAREISQADRLGELYSWGDRRPESLP